MQIGSHQGAQPLPLETSKSSPKYFVIPVIQVPSKLINIQIILQLQANPIHIQNLPCKLYKGAENHSRS